jgi:hypothetical protein
LVEFDGESGWFVLVRLTNNIDTTRGSALYLAGSKKSVHVSVYMCKVRGVNEAAKEELRRIHSDKTAALMARIRDLPLFLSSSQEVRRILHVWSLSVCENAKCSFDLYMSAPSFCEHTFLCFMKVNADETEVSLPLSPVAVSDSLHVPAMWRECSSVFQLNIDFGARAVVSATMKTGWNLNRRSTLEQTTCLGSSLSNTHRMKW